MNISIITATYNSSSTIKTCIESINSQSFREIEHIIIDCASTDKTLEIVKSTSSRVTKIISEPDEGIYDAMNKGIRLATGSIIGILNSDDLYTENTVIEKIVRAFETTGVDCIYADMYYVNKNDISEVVRYWKTSDFIPGAFSTGWHPAHPSFFVRRRVYEKYGLFNLDFVLAADFELMLRLLERHRITSLHLSEPIVRMRLGGKTNRSIRNIIRQNIECYKAFKINNINVSLLYPFYRLLPKLRQFLNA